jgi:hypothetical protein
VTNNYTGGYNLSVSVDPSDSAQSVHARKCEQTVDKCSQVFHIAQVIICWPTGATYRIKDLLSKTQEDIWMFGEHVSGKCESSCGLNSKTQSVAVWLCEGYTCRVPASDHDIHDFVFENIFIYEIFK